MFKTRRKSIFSRQSSYSLYGKRRPSLTRWQVAALVLLSLLGTELLLRVVVRLTGQGDALQAAAGGSALVRDYRLHYTNAAGESYDDLRPQGNLVVRRSPLQGYELIPNQAGEHWNINAEGIRGSSLEPQKGKNEVRIVLLGGSTAFGYLSSSDETTVGQQLETKLRWRVQQQQKNSSQFQPLQLPYYADEQAIALRKTKRIPEKQYRVINIAVPGYISSNELTQFIRRGMAYQPDMIILLNGYADLLIPSQQVAADVPQLDQSQDNSWGQSVKAMQGKVGRLLTRFYVIRVPQRLLFRPQIEQQLEIPPLINVKQTNFFNSEEQQRRIQRYEQNLSSLAQMAAAAKIPLFVALQPQIGDRANHNPSPTEQQILAQMGQNYPATMVEAYQQLRKSIGTVKKRYGNVQSIDLTTIYHQAEDDIFLDPIHLTEIGNQTLAESLYGAVTNRLELEPTGYRGTPSP